MKTFNLKQLIRECILEWESNNDLQHLIEEITVSINKFFSSYELAFYKKQWHRMLKQLGYGTSFITKVKISEKGKETDIGNYGRLQNISMLKQLYLDISDFPVKPKNERDAILKDIKMFISANIHSDFS